MEIVQQAYVTFSLGKFIRTGAITDIFDTGGFEVDYEYGINHRNDLDGIITTREYTPTPKDKLYLVSGVTVPRSKVKNLKEDFNIASVRNLEKATHIVVSNKLLDSFIEANWEYKVKTSLLKIWLKSFLELNAIEACDDYDATKFKNAITDYLERYEGEYTYISYWTHSNFFGDKKVLQSLNLILRDENGNQVDCNNISKEDYSYVYRNLIGYSNKIMIEEWINSGLPIIDQNDIIGLLNGADATTLDGAMYESICDMLDSGDDDNTVVAMEIMANCHYRSSILYLALLFYKYGSKLEYMHERKHVNFQALASYMELSTNNLRMNINDIVSVLRNNESLTKSNLDLVLKWIGGDITVGETSLIKVKSITLSPELLEELNMNYIYERQEDYIPKPEVIENEVPEEISSPEQDDLTIEYVNTGEIEVKVEMVPNTDIKSSNLDDFLHSDMLVEKTTVTIPEDILDEESTDVESNTDTNEYFL